MAIFERSSHTLSPPSLIILLTLSSSHLVMSLQDRDRYYHLGADNEFRYAWLTSPKAGPILLELMNWNYIDDGSYTALPVNYGYRRDIENIIKTCL